MFYKNSIKSFKDLSNQLASSRRGILPSRKKEEDTNLSLKKASTSPICHEPLPDSPLMKR
jgi:hypothetical protein